jgi:hypothetical protein
LAALCFEALGAMVLINVLSQKVHSNIRHLKKKLHKTINCCNQIYDDECKKYAWN